MLFADALRAAMEQKKLMFRSSWPWETKLDPKSEKMPIDIVWPDGRRAPCWNPTPEDILADDWHISRK